MIQLSLQTRFLATSVGSKIHQSSGHNTRTEKIGKTEAVYRFYINRISIVTRTRKGRSTTVTVYIFSVLAYRVVMARS
jgi:hypothetical protein